MSSLATRARSTLVLFASAGVLAGCLTASSAATAKPIFLPKPGSGFGAYGAAALVGGLALGAIAASAAANADDGCYVVRRVLVDEDGNQYVRRVRVCD